MNGRSLSVLAAEAEKLRDWLFESSLPLWWSVGADRVMGGFHERINFEGQPVFLPRRSRVAARFAYCYVEAGRSGWQGPWREAAQHALNFLLERFVQGDGTVVATVREDGSAVEPKFDLYNQAFALFAYACGHSVSISIADWKSLAYQLVATLRRDFAHREIGFREDSAGELPLRANPHMHLLEAALAWSAIDSDPVWRELADEMGKLCLDRFIDKKTGALREFFAQDWAPVHKPDTEVVEPGHHYEWAYLLDRWAKTTTRSRPEEVSGLITFADDNGIDRRRTAAVNEIRLDGSAYDPVARLWPQTERLRAYVIDRDTDDDPRLREAIATLWRYLDAPRRGLWYENLDANGQFIVEAAPATSLYHIVGAVMELCAVFGSNAQSRTRTPG